ncbi:hypothetical protein ScPMuIL_010455 [Solemya velum]
MSSEVSKSSRGRDRLTPYRRSNRRHSRELRRPSTVFPDSAHQSEDEDDLLQIDEEGEAMSTEDDILQNIRFQKEMIENMRHQPFSIAKKLNSSGMFTLSIVPLPLLLIYLSPSRYFHPYRPKSTFHHHGYFYPYRPKSQHNLAPLLEEKRNAFAKANVERHGGKLSKGRGYQQRGAQFWRRVKRETSNFIASVVPWDMRIKQIESHFGSVVASYFVFLRWILWINVWLMLLPLCFVIIPELIAGKPHGTVDRKTIPADEMEASADLKTIWNAEVWCSAIFCGVLCYYGNSETIGNGYRLPLAYLLAGFATFAFSFMVVLRKMAENSRQSRLSNKDEQFIFAWKLFSSWDFTIGHHETANNKVASISTTFKESILEEQENKRRRIGLRILANFLVVIVLASSTYLITWLVSRSRHSNQGTDTNFWQENELTVVMTLISTLFPNFFDVISLMEKYHPRTNLRWQLPGKERQIFVLNLLNLYTLFIALYYKKEDMSELLEFARQSGCNTTRSVPPTPFRNATVDVKDIEIPSITDTNCTSTVVGNATQICWETMVGQEVFKLTIMDLVFTVGQIVVLDFLRGLFLRFCNNLCCWDLEKTFPEYADFKTAENILHLINNQGMIWLGTFFAPGLPVLNLFKLVLMVYIRCWSVMACNVPQERIFRASRSNNFYYALLLIMLFLCTLPPLFAIVALEPSTDCGPFSGQSKMFTVLTDTLESELPALATNIINYAASPGGYYSRLSASCERTEGKRKIYAMADGKIFDVVSASWRVVSGIANIYTGAPVAWGIKRCAQRLIPVSLTSQRSVFEPQCVNQYDMEAKRKLEAVSEDTDKGSKLVNSKKVLPDSAFLATRVNDNTKNRLGGAVSSILAAAKLSKLLSSKPGVDPEESQVRTNAFKANIQEESPEENSQGSHEKQRHDARRKKRPIAPKRTQRRVSPENRLPAKGEHKAHSRLKDERLSEDEPRAESKPNSRPLIEGEQRAEPITPDSEINATEPTLVVNEMDNQVTPGDIQADDRPNKRKQHWNFKKLTKLAVLKDTRTEQLAEKTRRETEANKRRKTTGREETNSTANRHQSDNRPTRGGIAEDNYISDRGISSWQEKSTVDNWEKWDTPYGDVADEDDKVRTIADHEINATTQCESDADSEQQAASDSEPQSENDDSDPTPENRRRLSLLTVGSSQEPSVIREDYDASHPINNDGHNSKPTTIRTENETDSQNDLYKYKIDLKKKKKLAGAVMTPLSMATRPPRKRTKIVLPVPEIKVTDYSGDSSDSSEPIQWRKQKVAATVHVTPDEIDVVSIDSVVVDVLDDDKENQMSNRRNKYIYRDNPMDENEAENADYRNKFQRALAHFQNIDK